VQANHESWISRQVNRLAIAIMHDRVPVTMTGIVAMPVLMMSITIHNMPGVMTMDGMGPVCAIVSHMGAVLITSLLTLLRVLAMALVVAMFARLGMMPIPAVLGMLRMPVPLIIVTRHGNRWCQGKTCNQRG